MCPAAGEGLSEGLGSEETWAPGHEVDDDGRTPREVWNDVDRIEESLQRVEQAINRAGHMCLAATCRRSLPGAAAMTPPATPKVSDWVELHEGLALALLFLLAMTEETARNVEEPDPDTRAHHEILRKLLGELSQTERSASRHARRECRRYGSAPPARALLAVAEHADREQRQIADIVRRADMRSSRIGALVGESFSLARHLIADRVVDAERSYRGTLLGMRHGVDLVDLIRRVADASGEVEMGGFCTRWLEERRPLVDQVAHELAWFASHPQRATETPRPRILARLTGAGHASERARHRRWRHRASTASGND
jgi:hypothetical protein